MKVKNISYPHPVLGNKDDVSGIFNPGFSHRLGREKISLRTKFELKNKTLENLIKDKKACFFIEAECSNTFYRNSFTTFEYDSEFKVDTERLRENVSIKFFIRAAEQIKNYEIEGSHEDYSGFMFDIDKGDILAFGGITSFIAEKEFDPLKPAISSFMVIREGNETNGPIAVDYEDPEKINIILSKEDWERYQHIKGRQGIPPLLHSSIVLPVLADAIRMIYKNDEDIENTHWSKRIEAILNQKKFTSDFPLISAQLILDSPVNRGFKSLEDFLNSE